MEAVKDQIGVSRPFWAGDTGLMSLVLMARVHGIPVDPAQIAHQFCDGQTHLRINDLLRAAKHLNLKARGVPSEWNRLKKTALPAIAAHKSGRFFVIAKLVDQPDGTTKVLVHDPEAGRPTLISRQELMDVWTGRLILIAKRASLVESFRKFDIAWFVPAILKYRRILGEVLLTSFFLQLFALVSPLFFQVVIDKVLVHRGLTTLDVLVIGLAIITLFEVLLGGLRTYTFSHTTNRVDVELGVRVVLGVL